MTSDHPADPHTFDAQWWEQHYQDGHHQDGHCRDGHSQDGHCRDVTAGPADRPSPHLLTELAGLRTGTVLDAGCGTGADAIWLAGQGWDVTAVDVSPTAVRHAQALAARHQPEVAGRIRWLVADLTGWQPPRRYDLVLSQYVHPDQPFGEFVARLADAVAPGGTLLVVGHDHADSHSAAHAPQAASIGPEAVTRALDDNKWQVTVAETRTRQVTGQRTFADLVVRANRRPVS